MDNLQFIQRLYNGKYCYSDSMTEEQISLLHIASGVEDIIRLMVEQRRIVFLTGSSVSDSSSQAFSIRFEVRYLMGETPVCSLNKWER